ncbi:EAL domain-containing protein, partial [Acinetobacter nectaris]|uniref:EAL domain-containing protein n=1 Tax=Acinetobacter nectaris TaxID=1219382 RepID=UPI001F2EBC0D
MRNYFLSDRLKQMEIRLLIIDDNQIRYNQINELLLERQHKVYSILLDDINSFEKQLNLQWDIILFGRAYDLKIEQAINLIKTYQQPETPLLLLNPEGYDPTQYVSYINKGIYDLFNLDYIERFYIGLLRTFSFSRSIQLQKKLETELEKFDAQIQSHAKENESAIALIQEGIHLEANAEYLKLFNIDSEDEIIGLPLLDLLQPENIQQFKQNFKKANQNQLDIIKFQLISKNNILKNRNLHLTFIPDNEKEGLRLIINQEDTPSLSSNISYESINHKIKNKDFEFNTLLIISAHEKHDLSTLPLNDTEKYISAITDFLHEQIQNTVIRLSPSLYIGLIQAPTEHQLKSKLIGIKHLHHDNLIEVNKKNYTISFNIGFTEIQQPITSQEEFNQYYVQALTCPLTYENSQDISTKIKFNSDIEISEISQAVSSSFIVEEKILDNIKKSLADGSIHLKYQQLYDKLDAQLYTYEVFSGIIHKNEWVDLIALDDLRESQALSVILDRWVIIEACKQLSNYSVQHPETKLIINLNTQILSSGDQLIPLLKKILSMLSHASSNSLILKFSAPDIIAADLVSHSIWQTLQT